jgi:hypothetical protein
MSNTSNRIQSLEEEVERLRRYIIIRDGLWIEDHMDEIGDHMFSYEDVGDSNLSMQLEFDNLMMCRAFLQEDFLEYCRRAILQVEGMVDWALEEIKSNKNLGLIKKGWNIVQNNKKKRWRGTYTKDSYPGSISDIGLLDSIEISFYIFINNNYQSFNKTKNRFDSIINASKIRNISSHRQDISDVKKRASNKNVGRFYKNRKSNGSGVNSYEVTSESVNVLRGGIVRYF